MMATPSLPIPTSLTRHPRAKARLTRRHLLRGSAATVLGALLAACGQTPTATTPSTLGTAIPAPTRIISIPTPLPSPTAPPTASREPTSGATVVWQATDDLLHPGHLALDSQGNLYVTDDEHQRIQKFDANGQLLLRWGRPGTGDGEFHFRSAHQDHSPIAGIAVDAQDTIYVCDATARVQLFDTRGTFRGVWSAAGMPSNLPAIPCALAVAPNGNLYVVDTNNHRVQTFSRTGQFLSTWGHIGSGDGEFSVPSGIACDRRGNVFVVDINNNRVQQFDANGTFVRKWGTSGFADGTFNGPSGVGVDTIGNVYVADTGNHRIEKFTPMGVLIGKWGRPGAGDGELRDPTDVAVGAQDVAYVVDDSNNRIVKFAQR